MLTIYSRSMRTYATPTGWLDHTHVIRAAADARLQPLGGGACWLHRIDNVDEVFQLRRMLDVGSHVHTCRNRIVGFFHALQMNPHHFTSDRHVWPAHLQAVFRRAERRERCEVPATIAAEIRAAALAWDAERAAIWLDRVEDVLPWSERTLAAIRAVVVDTDRFAVTTQ